MAHDAERRRLAGRGLRGDGRACSDGGLRLGAGSPLPSHPMPTTSAGLVLFRECGGTIEVLLGHMGGPYWARKDERAWSIPKGELDDGEEPLAGALREFAEELGHPPPETPVVELGEIRQRGGKRVIAFAIEVTSTPTTSSPAPSSSSGRHARARPSSSPSSTASPGSTSRPRPRRSSRRRPSCSTGSRTRCLDAEAHDAAREAGRATSKPQSIRKIVQPSWFAWPAIDDALS